MKALYLSVALMGAATVMATAQENRLQLDPPLASSPDSGIAGPGGNAAPVLACRETLDSPEGLGAGALDPADISDPTVETCNTVLNPPAPVLPPDPDALAQGSVDADILTGAIGR